MSEEKKAQLAKAYEFWAKNPHMQKQDLCLRLGIHGSEFGYWMHINGKERPDGLKHGKGSPRQKAIKDAYEATLARKGTVLEALKEARKFSPSVGKGDILYYGVKNNLPPLAEKPSEYQTSPNKLPIAS